MGTTRRKKLVFLSMTGGLMLALGLRYFLLPWISVDMVLDFAKSYDRIRELGFAAFKERITVYTPPYYYLLALATRFPIDKLYAIKSISILFDFLAAGVVYKLIALKYTGKKAVPWLGALTFLCLPTVAINSSMWGQFDIVHTTFILLALYFSMIARNKKDLALMLFFFGMALSVKGIALFVLPWVLLAMYVRKMPAVFFLLIPLAYLLLMTPAWVAGRGFGELLMVPLDQVAAETRFTANAPTIFQWLPQIEILKSVAVLLAILAIFVFFVFLAKRPGLRSPSKEMMLKTCLFSSMFIPFFLPQMHDRYFFVADVLSLIYAFYFPRKFFIALGVQAASLLSYAPLLLNADLVPLPLLSGILLAVILFLFVDLVKSASVEGRPAAQAF